ncbi:hypothetical protein ACWGKW_03830 [Streptomyces sp. NPDC054766]
MYQGEVFLDERGEPVVGDSEPVVTPDDWDLLTEKVRRETKGRGVRYGQRRPASCARRSGPLCPRPLPPPRRPALMVSFARSFPESAPCTSVKGVDRVVNAKKTHDGVKTVLSYGRSPAAESTMSERIRDKGAVIGEVSGIVSGLAEQKACAKRG